MIVVEYPYVEGPTIKVRVKQDKRGEYEYCRRRSGDVFTLKPRYVTVVNKITGEPEYDEKGDYKTKLLTAADQFSPRWMEKVADDEPVKITSAPQALAQEQASLKDQTRPPRRM